jgi:hypothetical protein
MDAPQESFYPERRGEALMILFKIISRRSWDELQGWHKAFPGSQVEHVMKGTGIYVLHIPPGGARGKEAAA